MMSPGYNRLLWVGVLAISLSCWAGEPNEPAGPNWIESAKADLRLFPDRLKTDAKAA